MFDLLGRGLDRAFARLPEGPARFARFLVVGGLNTLFGYALFVALVSLPIPRFVALLLSTVGGTLFNFRSTGSIVFAQQDPRLLWRFVAVYAALLGVNYAGLEALIARGLSVYVASAAMILPMAVLGFLMQRQFVFRGGDR